MNDALTVEEDLRRRALEEQAGAGHTEQPPVNIPLPTPRDILKGYLLKSSIAAPPLPTQVAVREPSGLVAPVPDAATPPPDDGDPTPAASLAPPPGPSPTASLDPLPVTKAPLYPKGATAADLTQAYDKKRGSDFIAQMLNAGATVARGAGANIPGNVGDTFKESGNDAIKEVMARRQVADEDRKQQDAVDSGQFSKWLFSKLPVTAETAKSIGPEGLSQVAGLDPQALIKENVEYAKSQKAAGVAANQAKFDATSPISKQAQAQKLAELQANDPERYAKWKDVIPLMSYDQLSTDTKMNAPRGVVKFDPSTGLPVAYNSRDMSSVQGAVTKFGTPSAPDANTGLPNTPKMNLERQKAILKLGSPPADFQWAPEVLKGEVAPPAKKEVDKANEVTSASGAILDFGKRIDQFLKQHPNGFPAGKDISAIEPFIVATETMARAANQMGVYRSFDQPILNRIVADPGSIKTNILSTLGIRDLATQFKAFQDETMQRVVSLNQEIHRSPARNGRIAGFQSVTALPAQAPQGGVPAEETKTVGGKNYVKVNGKWHVED